MSQVLRSGPSARQRGVIKLMPTEAEPLDGQAEPREPS
jgi:hypothetical protein